MLKYDVAELTGLFSIAIGLAVIIGAAALVSTALAVAVAGVFLLMGGVLTVYIANELSARAQAATEEAHDATR